MSYTKEQLEEVKARTEKALKEAKMQSPEWHREYEMLGLIHMAERDSQIGDIVIKSEPDYPEHPNALGIYVDGKKLNYICEDADTAMLIALSCKHLEINEARYFVSFACRMLKIKNDWAA